MSDLYTSNLLDAARKGLHALRLEVPDSIVSNVINRAEGAFSALSGSRATHRCKQCSALWVLNPPSKAQPDGSWSLLPGQRAGICCDNVPMGDQIENLETETEDRPEPMFAVEQALGAWGYRLVQVDNKFILIRPDGKEAKIRWTANPKPTPVAPFMLGKDADMTVAQCLLIAAFYDLCE